MDQNGPPVPPSDFLLRSASGRASADIDPQPEPCGNDAAHEPSVGVYYRNEQEVRDGFLIALHAMGLAGAEEQAKPATPRFRDAKP
jgi:hypothetical protein